MISINKKEDVFKLIIQEYDKRNFLIRKGASGKELAENKKIIEDLVDRYVGEYVGKNIKREG